MTSAPAYCVPVIPLRRPGQRWRGGRAHGRAWGFIMVMGDRCRQRLRRSTTGQPGCSGAGFNLPDGGFSWPFLFFCQIGSGRGLAVSLEVRSTETSSSSPCGGWLEGRMEPESPPPRTGMGSISGLWPSWIGPPKCTGAGLGLSHIGAPCCCQPPQPEVSRMP